MPRWTPEARAKQAEKIKEWRPWDSSTGPTSEGGKKRSALNRDAFWDDPEAMLRDAEGPRTAAALLAELFELRAEMARVLGKPKRRRRRPTYRHRGYVRRVLIARHGEALKTRDSP